MHQRQPPPRKQKFSLLSLVGSVLVALVSIGVITGIVFVATATRPAILPASTSNQSAQPTAHTTSAVTLPAITNETPTEDSGLVHVNGAMQISAHSGIAAPNMPPIAYLILLDTSGSMSYNIQGEGTFTGTISLGGDTTGGADYTCELNSASALRYNEFCQGGPNSAWRTVKERRIYQAKAMVAALIGKLNPFDIVRLVPFTTGIGPANYQVLPTNGWTSDKQVLYDTLLTAGSFNGDPYRTAGGSSNAQAMRGAKQVWDAAPNTAPNGQPYRQVMLMIADGPANIFLAGNSNPARDICSDISANVAMSTVRCQIGYSADTQQFRPVMAMIEQANQLKQEYPSLIIYTIAAGNTDVGLKDVASSPRMYYTTMGDRVIGAILAEQQVTATCSVAENSVTSIDAAHLPGFTPEQALPEGVYGQVTLLNANRQQAAQAPIVHNPTSGVLSYDLGLLPPGAYLLQASIWYRGDDGVTRVYTHVGMDSVGPQAELPVSIDASTGNALTLPTLSIGLDPAIDVCVEGLGAES